MASFLLVGSGSSCEQFSDHLIKKEKIPSYNITVFEETIKIDEARKLRFELISKQSSKRLFVIKNGMTIEAQNSLLKLLEEIHESVYFVFFAKSDEDFLPTIRSRCLVKFLERDKDYGFVAILKSIDVFAYNEVDMLAEQCGKDVKSILPSLRELLLDGTLSVNDRRRYYIYCKRLMSLQKLSEVNNVNERILLEKVFLG